MKENADKHRAMDTAEVQKNFRESAEQMFRLRFQMSLGQAEGLKKYRALKKDRARMLTVLREREINAAAPQSSAVPKKAAAAKPVAAKKTAAKPAVKKAAAKPAAAKAAVVKNAPAKKVSKTKKG
jgi:large subunit ribosomal protein L29